MTVSAELPGMDRGDVHVEVDGDVLTLRGEKQEERRDEGKQYHLVERRYGSFQRSFTVPRTVDTDSITADFDRGVLTVRLPKTKEARAHGREILISGKK